MLSGRLGLDKVREPLKKIVDTDGFLLAVRPVR